MSNLPDKAKLAQILIPTLFTIPPNSFFQFPASCFTLIRELEQIRPWKFKLAFIKEQDIAS